MFMIIQEIQKIWREFFFQVLRFSRLFGPGKKSSLPQIWRGVKKRRKKQKKESHADKSKVVTSDSDMDAGNRKKKGWNLNIASPPPPEQCESDDEVSEVIFFYHICWCHN